MLTKQLMPELTGIRLPVGNEAEHYSLII